MRRRRASSRGSGDHQPYPVSPPELEIVIEGDRRFFHRFQHRSFRVRLMALAEAAAFERAGNPVPPPPDGWRWYVAVRKHGPGIRERRLFQSPATAETDLTEELACGLYLAAVDAARNDRPYGIVDPQEVDLCLKRGARR